MQNIGSIVSRDNIMRKLWENESFVDDNTLTVNVARVRKKLAELEKRSLFIRRKGKVILLHEYFSLHKRTPLFYASILLIMLFISTMIYLSEGLSNTKANLIYINVVSAIFILIYLIIGYFYHKRFYKELHIALHLEQDTVIAIPAPHTYEQELYTDILKNCI